MITTQHSPVKQHQRGATLIVSLLLLVVMTMIGVAAMRSNMMEEKMSGNQRDQNLAFQAAEAGLRDAETFIEGVVSTAAFNGSAGLYGESDSEPDVFNMTWDASNSRSYSGTTLAEVASQPRYIIKYLGETGNTNTTPSIGGYGSVQSTTTKLFRITVRGTGGSDNSQAFLQSHYARKF